MEPEPLLDSLRNAVTAMPDDVPLRLHLATMLLRAGHRDEAVRHLGAVLQRDPGNAEAMRMLTSPAEASAPPPPPPADLGTSAERAHGSASPAPGSAPAQDAADGVPGGGAVVGGPVVGGTAVVGPLAASLRGVPRGAASRHTAAALGRGGARGGATRSFCGTVEVGRRA